MSREALLTNDLSADAGSHGRTNPDSGLLRAKSASIDAERRQVRVLASNDTLDRDGERILPSAFTESLKTYRQNPVILAGHQHRTDSGASPVVGRSVRVWVDKRGLWAVIEFASTSLGEEYWQLYRDGFMRAVSVGFMVKDFDERSEIVDGQTRRIRVVTKAELYEISCVSVPANPDALVKSQAKKEFVELKKQERSQEYRLDPEVRQCVEDDYRAGLMSHEQYRGWISGKHVDDFGELTACFGGEESVGEIGGSRRNIGISSGEKFLLKAVCSAKKEPDYASLLF